MKIIAFLILGLTCINGLSVHAQTQSDYEKEYKKEYEWRIKQARLDGVYIPMNLEDAFVELDRLSDDKSITKFKTASEDVVVEKLHFGLGKWIVINWGLYDGSRYGHYLKEMGLSHPDDMSQFTIRMYHRHLNGISLNEAEEVAKLVQNRLKLLQSRKDTMP